MFSVPELLKQVHEVIGAYVNLGAFCIVHLSVEAFPAGLKYIVLVLDLNQHLSINLSIRKCSTNVNRLMYGPSLGPFLFAARKGKRLAHCSSVHYPGTRRTELKEVFSYYKEEPYLYAYNIAV